MSRDTTNMHDAHCDPEELALAALGERTEIDTEHLAACDSCQADLASLRRVVRLTRSGTEEHISSPAPSVWQAVEAQMQSEASLNVTAGSAHHGPSGGTADASDSAPGPVDDLSDESGAVVVPMRRRTAPWLAAAAAVGVLVGGIAGVAWTQGSAPQPTVVAQAALEPLPGYPSSGTARIETTGDGDTVTVNLVDLPATEGYYEVWLLTEDASAMVSLGAVGPGETSTLPLPPGIALDRFRIVDISAEEFDGDPTHSTISVARGDLQA